MSGAVNRGYSFPERPGTKQSNVGTSGGQTTNIIDTATESAKEFGSTVASKAEEAWDTSKRTAQEFATSAANKAEDAFDSVTDLIGRYPGYAMLFAFGVGFLLSEALRGFSHSQTSDFYSRR